MTPFEGTLILCERLHKRRRDQLLYSTFHRKIKHRKSSLQHFGKHVVEPLSFRNVWLEGLLLIRKYCSTNRS